MRGPYLVVTRYISAITIPAALGLAVLARPLVHSVFGTEWLSAAPILSALAIVAAVRCLSAHAGDVLKATGRSSLLVRLSAVKAILIVPALIAGAAYGAVEVAVALALATGVGTAVTLVYASRVIGVSMREIAASFFPSVAAGGIMAVALISWLGWTSRLVPSAQVAGGVVIGGLVYLAALAVLDRELLRRARQQVFGRLSPEEVLRGTPP